MEKINSALFKSVMSKFTTGVTIITINNNNYIGKTVNSFAPISLNPPLVLFSLEKKSSFLKDYTKSSFFGINILSRKQKKLSIYFAKLKPKWGRTGFFLSKNNIPLIEGSVANLNCKSIKTISQGDHIIFICKTLEAKLNSKLKPLVYLNSNYI
ncbi:flavin reductase family protein [Alphaproteobacteria bacterium]|nr:flavin reductase family protein [Alphaproteobacteria bacterium]